MEVDDPNILVENFLALYENSFKLAEDCVEIRMFSEKLSKIKSVTQTQNNNLFGKWNLK